MVSADFYQTHKTAGAKDLVYSRNLSSKVDMRANWAKHFLKKACLPSLPCTLNNSPLIQRYLPAPIGISEDTTISMGIKSRSDSLEMATHKYKSATRPSLCDKCSSGHVSKTIWVKLSRRTLSISVTVFRS